MELQRAVVFMGTCGLCLEHRKLVKSHALPKALYKLSRDEREPNSNPVLLLSRPPIQTSAQFRDYFLCADCDGRFNKKGETWVMRHCFQGASNFKLRKLLTTEIPVASGEVGSAYLTAHLKTIDHDALTYFPLSIFWRFGARTWRIRGSNVHPIRLGTYKEQIRLYLLGQIDFPSHITLSVLMSNEAVPLLASHFPMWKRDDGGFQHEFHIPGIHFLMRINKGDPAEHYKTCFVHGPGRPIICLNSERILKGNLRASFKRQDH